MRHIGAYDRSTVIVLGHNEAKGKFLVLNPSNLSTPDQEWIGEVVQSDYAQNRMNLFDAFQREHHNSGENGWRWVVARATEIPVHEVTLADESQSEHWLGVPSNYDSKLEENKLSDKENIPESPIATDPSVYGIKGTSSAPRETIETSTGNVDMTSTRQPLGTKEPSAVDAATLEALKALTDSVQSLTKKVGELDKAQRTANREMKKASKTDAKTASK